jgi:glycosyltransferase involved in cell wall biosynthesis
MDVRPKVLFIGPVPRKGVIGGVATVTGCVMNSHYLKQCFNMEFLDLEECVYDTRYIVRACRWLIRQLTGINLYESRLLTLRVANAVKEIWSFRPEIIVCFFSHNHFFWLMGRIAIAARQLGICFIADYHADGFEGFINSLSKKKQAKARNVFKSVDVILVRNAESEKYFINKMPYSKLMRMFNPVPLGFAMTPADDSASDMMRADDCIRIAFVGVGSPQNKGAYILIQGISELLGSGVHPVIRMAGPNKECLCQHITTLSKEVQDCICFTGPLTPIEVRSLFESSDIFIMPSYSECFPMALLEAMSCGLACVGTRVGAIPDMLAEGECGVLINAGDTSQLAAALIKLCKNGKYRKSLGNAAKKRVQMIYTLPVFERTLEKVIRDCLI